jgi:hypothetical protein
MTTHKTFGGMVLASRRLITELLSLKIDNDRDYRAYKKKVDHLHAELRVLWSNPEDQRRADEIRCDLDMAFHYATN